MGMLRETLRGLRSTVITLLALAAAAVAVYVLLTVLDSTHTAARRALLEGNMATAGRDAGESDRPSGRKVGEARDALPRGMVIHNQERIR
jgi:hypothetical protein